MMAFQTGTATSQHNLLDIVRTFCAANGWTINQWADVGSGKRLHISKGNLYFNFRSAENEVTVEQYQWSGSYHYVTGIALNGSTGYDGGQTWDKQPGYSITTQSRSWGVCINGVSGAIPAYYLFTLGVDSVCLVTEYQTGKYQWLIWGTLDKSGAGSYTGGAFFAGSRSPVFASYPSVTAPTGPFGYTGDFYGFSQFGVYLDIDGSSELWRPVGYYDHDRVAPTDRAYTHGTSVNFPNATGQMPADNAGYQKGLMTPVMRASPNSFNGLAPFFPIIITARRASDRQSLVGQIPNMRMLNVTNLSAADEIAHGSDTWMVFPQHCKGDTYGGEIGYAVLKVV